MPSLSVHGLPPEAPTSVQVYGAVPPLASTEAL